MIETTWRNTTGKVHRYYGYSFYMNDPMTFEVVGYWFLDGQLIKHEKVGMLSRPTRKKFLIR
jgi:hypothetical protein